MTATQPAVTAASASVRTTDRLFNLQHRQKRLLRNFHRAYLLHALLPLPLLLQKFALAGHVSAIALRRHVLAQRPDRLPRDHLGADGGLNHDLEQLAWNQVLELLGDLASPFIRFISVNDDAESVDRLAVQQHIELHEFPGAIGKELIVERRIAARNRLQLVVEIEDDFRQRKLEMKFDARRVQVMHPLVDAATLLAELHDATD